MESRIKHDGGGATIHDNNALINVTIDSLVEILRLKGVEDPILEPKVNNCYWLVIKKGFKALGCDKIGVVLSINGCRFQICGYKTLFSHDDERSIKSILLAPMKQGA